MADTQHTDLRPDAGRVRGGVVEAGGRTLAGAPLDEPYIGFSAYDETRAEFLGGRDAEILVLVSNIRVSPLTVLYGPTGVGKSSTLCAGVIPALKRDTSPDPALADVAPAVVYFKEWQAADFEASINEACLAAVNWGAEGRPPLPEPCHLDDIVRAAQARDLSVILIFDQFEDYLVAGNRGAAEFDRVIARLVNRRDLSANVLISIQEDHIAKLDRLRTRIPHLLGNAIRMDPLDEVNAALAIRKPLAAFNAHAPAADRTEMGQGDEDPVPVVIADGRADAFIEPAFLQLVMRQLWREETKLWRADPSKGRMLRRSVLVTRLGGVRALIDSHLQTTLGQALARRELPIAARIFRSLVNSRGEKVSLFSEEIARAVEPGFPRSVRRMLTSWRARAAAVDPPWPPAMAVLQKLGAAKLLRRIPGDRYELFHQVLAPSVLAWQRRFEAARQKRMLAVSLIAFGLIVSVGVGLVVRQRTRDQRARSTLFAQYARDVPPRDPKLAMTLALYSLQQSPTASARDVLLLALDRTRGRLAAHTQQVTSVTFNGDGTLLASAGADNAVKFWRLPSETFAGSFSPHNFSVNAVMFRPGHQQVVTASDDRTAILWDVSNLEKPTRIFRLGEGDEANQHQDEIWGAAMSPDGKFVVTVGKDRTAKLWDLDTGRWVRNFVGHTDSIVAATFSPDGRTIATAGLDKDVWIWDTDGGTHYPLHGHTDYVYGLSFSPDGRQLASGGWDQSVIVWDLNARSIAYKLTATSRVWGVAFNPVGKEVAAAIRDGNLIVWDTTTGAVTRLIPGEGGVLTQVAYAPSGSAVAAGTIDGVVRLFQLPGLKDLHGQLTSAAFSRDGTLIAGGTANAPASPAGTTYDVKLWAPDGQVRTTLDTSHRHANDVVSLAISGDGRYVLTGSRDKRARLWSAGGAFVAEPHPHADVVHAVALNQTGSRLATGSWDSWVVVWDRADAQLTLRRQFEPFDTERVYALAFAPDGRHLAAGGYADYVRIDDVDDEKSVVKLPLPRKQTVLAVGYSADGSHLAAGFDDGSLYVWTYGAGGWQKKPSELLGHNTSVMYLTFDAGGRRLATSSMDGTARVWEVETGQLTLTVPSQGEATRAVLFQGKPPHEQLLTVTASGRLRADKIDWDPNDWADPASLLNIAAQRTRELTVEECERYFGGRCPGDVPHRTE